MGTFSRSQWAEDERWDCRHFFILPPPGTQCPLGLSTRSSLRVDTLGRLPREQRVVLGWALHRVSSHLTLKWAGTKDRF